LGILPLRICIATLYRVSLIILNENRRGGRGCLAGFRQGFRAMLMLALVPYACSNIRADTLAPSP